MTIAEFCSQLDAVKANLLIAAPESLPDDKAVMMENDLRRVRLILAKMEHKVQMRSRHPKADPNQFVIPEA